MGKNDRQTWKICKTWEFIQILPRVILHTSGNTFTAVENDKIWEIRILWQDAHIHLWQWLQTEFQNQFYLECTRQNDWLCAILSPCGPNATLLAAAQGLSRIVAGPLQRLALERMIVRNTRELSAQQQQTLTSLAMLRAAQKGLNVQESVYIASIRNRLMDCFKQNLSLHMEGFLVFRMQDYARDWAECVEEVFSKAIAKYEYDSYVQFLKELIRQQPSQCPYAKIQREPNGNYRLWANDTVRVFRQRLVHPLGGTAEEDLICALLLLAPEQLEIEVSEAMQNSFVLQTLLKVFEGQVILKKNGR